MANKPCLTIADQIKLLQSRGMLFRDINAAPHFLSNISYYRLKGYWWEMQDDKIKHTFQKGICFEDALDLYNFDRHFRIIVFNAIERIEISLRTKLIYHFSQAYGPQWYLNSALFTKQKEYGYFISKLFRDMSSSSEEFMVKHYQNHPEDHPESWKGLEVLTLGSLSKLYQNLDHQLPEKNQIAREFGLFNQKYLVSWLLAVTLVRNIVAHHGRLWNRIMINKYDWPKKTPDQLLSYVPDNYQRRKIFPLLSAMLYMNNQISPGHHIKDELLKLFKEFQNVPLYKMGFPKTWNQEALWKS